MNATYWALVIFLSVAVGLPLLIALLEIRQENRADREFAAWVQAELARRRTALSELILDRGNREEASGPDVQPTGSARIGRTLHRSIYKPKHGDRLVDWAPIITPPSVPSPLAILPMAETSEN